ncbi:phage tail protein, partial [filamentous cyanobacterium CCT1]
MPITPTYPGVYIEEIPSGVRTIIGVATSITAFVGRAKRGPVEEPIAINNYGDFERVFGGLWIDSPMSFAVRDFYLNGGSQAIVVRLHEGATPSQLAVPSATATNTLDLVAANPGTWGDRLRGRVDHDVSAEVATALELVDTDLFNLTVTDLQTGLVEEFRNLTVIDSPRRVDQILENQSSLVRVVSLAAVRPDANDADLIADLADPDPGVVELAQEELQKPPFTSDIRSSGVDLTTGGGGGDGSAIDQTNFVGPGKANAKEGLYALMKTDLFNLLCIPPYTLLGGGIDPALITAAATLCEERRAMLILDPPAGWSNKDLAKTGIAAGVGTTSRNAAIFFPLLKQPNPLRSNQMEPFAPCGAVAGIFARTDAQRGVWKAPAGLEATLNGVPDLSVKLTDAENGELNPLGVNCLRSFPG